MLKITSFHRVKISLRISELSPEAMRQMCWPAASRDTPKAVTSKGTTSNGRHCYRSRITLSDPTGKGCAEDRRGERRAGTHQNLFPRREPPRTGVTLDEVSIEVHLERCNGRGMCQGLAWQAASWDTSKPAPSKGATSNEHRFGRGLARGLSRAMQRSI